MTTHSIAVVSGKGGSGKTVIATAMGLLFGAADRDLRIILMDADIGTAGMSYYLGLKEVVNIRNGFSTLALHPERSAEGPAKLLQPLKSYRHEAGSKGYLKLLPVGDHRRINREYQRGQAESSQPRPLVPLLQEAIQLLKAEADLLIVDCRGGIDDESLAVCHAVDEIILVIEPDTTSFQASWHLVDVLTDVDLVHKLHGFIINKVYSNPEAVIRNGGSTFGVQFLGAIPFDISTCRSFLVGDLPKPSSIFAGHVAGAMNHAYPDQIREPRGRIWQPRDYDMANVFTPTSLRGGIVVAFLLLTVGIAFTLNLLNRPVPRAETVLVTLVISVAGAVSAALLPLSASMGRAPGRFAGLLRRMVLFRQ